MLKLPLDLRTPFSTTWLLCYTSQFQIVQTQQQQQLTIVIIELVSRINYTERTTRTASFIAIIQQPLFNSRQKCF